jgi:hypothetical protein
LVRRSPKLEKARRRRRKEFVRCTPIGVHRVMTMTLQVGRECTDKKAVVAWKKLFVTGYCAGPFPSAWDSFVRWTGWSRRLLDLHLGVLTTCLLLPSHTQQQPTDAHNHKSQSAIDSPSAFVVGSLQRGFS